MKKIDRLKKKIALGALKRHGWCFRQAAKELGFTGYGLHLMARRYGLIKSKTVKANKWVRAA